MIKVSLFEDISDTKLKNCIYIYVNSNIQNAFLMARDTLSDLDYSINDILEYHDLDLTETQLNEYFDTAQYIVFSESYRDKIKPIYKFFIYELIQWFVEVNDDLTEQIQPLEKELEQKIKNYYDSDEAEFVINQITDFTKYNEILFDDWDFLSPMIEDMVQLYLRNPLFFITVFSEIDLQDFEPLMPKDIKEQYCEYKDKITNIQKQNTNSNGINIKELAYDIVRICETIQSKPYMRDWIEDQYNDYIRDGLHLRKYTVRDQTRTGESATGVLSGEADIQVFHNGIPYAIIESIVMNSLEKKEISEHINKIYNYDKRGNLANYFISFIKAKNFKSFWEKYQQFIMDFDFDKDILQNDFFELNVKQGSELKCAVSVLNRSGQTTYLFHIVIHIE